MQVNTNLLNLMTQLLQAIERSGNNEPVYRNPDLEVQRLFKATSDAIVEQKFPEESEETSAHVAENMILGMIDTFMTR